MSTQDKVWEKERKRKRDLGKERGTPNDEEGAVGYLVERDTRGQHIAEGPHVLSKATGSQALTLRTRGVPAMDDAEAPAEHGPLLQLCQA